MLLVSLGLVIASSAGPVATASAAPPTISVSTTSVTLNRTVIVSGRAPRGRAVTLQLLRAGRWETAAVTEATSSGTYSLRAPTWWLGYRQVRVWTPSALLSPGGYSPTAGYHVLPRYAPAGRAADHRIDIPGYRWNPCRVIGWKFNPNGGSLRLLSDVRQAIGAVAAATGLRFSYEGGTARVGVRHASYRAGTEILVSWATPRQVRQLAGRNVALATTRVDHDTRQYVGASIALDRTHSLRHGFARRGSPTWGQVLMHELAHAVGLGHVAAARQNLYPRLNRHNHRFGAGDLAGLRRLGAEQRCLPRPGS